MVYSIKNDKKTFQLMNFPAGHPKFPGQLKGMKQVLLKRGLWRNGLVMQCKKAKDGSRDKCEAGVTDCCAKRILDFQPNFQKQKSLSRR